MIEHQWRTGVEGAERDELARLLTESARDDAESGFATFGLDDPVPPGTRYLLVWLLADERTGREPPEPTLAGCLRLEPDEATPGRAEVRMVVHPRFRSRGVATLLFERVGLELGAEGLTGRPLPDGIEEELHERSGQPGFDTRGRLSAALDKLRADGAEAGAITVDEGEDDLLTACRLLGFQYARTDVRYDAP